MSTKQSPYWKEEGVSGVVWTGQLYVFWTPKEFKVRGNTKNEWQCQRGAVERMPSTTNRGSYTCGEWVRTTWGESLTAWDAHTSEHSKASASGRIREDHHLMAAPWQTPYQGLFVHYLRGAVLSLPAQVLGGPLPPGGASPTITTGPCTTTLRGGFCGKRLILWLVCCSVTSWGCWGQDQQ